MDPDPGVLVGSGYRTIFEMRSEIFPGFKIFLDPDPGYRIRSDPDLV